MHPSSNTVSPLNEADHHQILAGFVLNALQAGLVLNGARDVSAQISRFGRVISKTPKLRATATAEVLAGGTATAHFRIPSAAFSNF